MSRSTLSRLPGAALGLFLFAAPGIATAQQTDGWPDWLKEAMARESADLDSRPVAAADGQYRFRLAGKPAEPDAFDGGWYFASDIEAEAPLECYLFSDDTELAALLVNLGEINIEANAEANAGPVGNRNVFAIDAGAIEGAPFLALEWMYTVGEAPNVRLGFTKVRAAIRGDIVLACSHNYLGYRETFANAFADFVRSAQQPSPDVPPYYEEVALQSFRGQPVGITRVTYARDAEGDSMINMVSSSLMPLGPTAVGSSDSATISWSTPDGRVINVYTADSENGELVNNLQLGRTEDGNWLSSGTFQGKQIEQVLDGDIEPLSELGQMQRVRALFASEKTEAVFPLWIANADPTRFLEGKLVRGEAAAEHRGKLILGPMSFDARFDVDGALTNASMSIGAATMSIDRVWVRGQL